MKKEDVGVILLVVLFLIIIGYATMNKYFIKEDVQDEICSLNPSDPACTGEVIQTNLSIEEINKEICSLNPDDPGCNNESATNSRSIDEINKEICSLNPSDPACL